MPVSPESRLMVEASLTSLRMCTECGHVDECGPGKCGECGIGRMWSAVECDVCHEIFFSRSYKEHHKRHYENLKYPKGEVFHVGS